MGYLTGTVAAETELLQGDLRAEFPRFTPEARRANWSVVELLRQVGLPKGATPAQMALAWLLSRKPWIVPIFDTTKVAHVYENIGALDLKLSVKELTRLDEAFSNLQIVGASSGPSQLAAIDDGAKAASTSEGGHGMSPLPKPAFRDARSRHRPKLPEP